MTTTNKEKTMSADYDIDHVLDETILEGKIFNPDLGEEAEACRYLNNRKQAARELHKECCDQLSVARKHLEADMNNHMKREVYMILFYKRKKADDILRLAELVCKAYSELAIKITVESLRQIDRMNTKMGKEVPDTPWGDEWGEIAYNAYKQSSKGKSLVSGKDIPEWDFLEVAIQKAWNESARAVRKAEDEAKNMS